MAYVEFYKLNNNGSQTVIATCRLNGTEVTCDGDDVFLSNLEKDGIRDHAVGSSRQMLFYKDGLRFLEQLKFNFTSGYLNASDVKE